MAHSTMRRSLIVSLLATVTLAGCSSGAKPAVPTLVAPPGAATAFSQAPTTVASAAGTAAAAAEEKARAALTAAARGASTAIPAAGTTAANLAGTAVPQVETRAASVPAAIATAVSQPLFGTTIDVRLSEFKVEMPTSITAGTTNFRVTNAGSAEHSFEVTGNGLDKKLDTNLKPGETRTLTVDLKAGAYKVFCPVDGHRDQGMVLDLTVK